MNQNTQTPKCLPSLNYRESDALSFKYFNYEHSAHLLFDYIKIKEIAIILQCSFYLHIWAKLLLKFHFQGLFKYEWFPNNYYQINWMNETIKVLIDSQLIQSQALLIGAA